MHGGCLCSNARRRIWWGRAGWQCVAHLSQIPSAGDFLNLDLLGEPLIVVRQNATGADSVVGLEPGASVIASWAAERNLVVRDDT